MKRWLLVVAAVSLAAGAFAAPSPPPLPRDSVYQLPVQLTDQYGRQFVWGSRRSKVQIVAMFYASCPFICPLLIDSGKAVARNLTPAERKRMGIMLISMDPKRDTPAVLLSVAHERKLEPSLWTLATPTLGDVRSIAAVLGIRYRSLADGEFNHTSALVLLDAQGRVLARTEQIGSQPDPEFLAAVHRATTTPVP